MTRDSVAVRVDPVLRDLVKSAAKVVNMTPRGWLEQAIQRALATQSVKLAQEAAWGRGECNSCGYAPCRCDND